MTVRLVRWMGDVAESAATSWRDAPISGRLASTLARSMDSPTALVLVERWASVDDLTAAIHEHGSDIFPPSATGKIPRDGIEIYRHAEFERRGTEWVDRTYTKSELAVSTGDRGPVRVVIICRREHAVASASVALDVADTLTEPGCEAFAYFADVEDPHNIVLSELWATQADYDRHWSVRLYSEPWRSARNDRAWGTVEVTSAEFYSYRPLRRYYDRLLPADGQWSSSVRWGL